MQQDAGLAWRSAGRVLLGVENEGPQLEPHVQVGLAVAVVAVVAIAGIMSGLTLGLLSMDRMDLELMLRTGSKQQEKFARRLYPVVSQPHWVLSTLVICNTAAGMALPLCLDRLVNVAVALVLSTTAIVLFGEILPQAVCSRYGLSIGGYAAPAVRVLMWLTAPISWPIGKGLDWMLGREQPVFGKRQISALVDLHRTSAGMGGPLNEEEAHVIQGMLDLSSKTGNRAMTPLDNVFMLSTDDLLDRPTLKRILDSGHSRVPVYRGRCRADIIGLILVKELLGVVGLAEPGSGLIRVRELRIRDLPVLPAQTPMTDLLNLFQTGHSHMALLLQPAQAAAGGKDASAAPSTTLVTCSSSSSSNSHASSGACERCGGQCSGSSSARQGPAPACVCSLCGAQGGHATPRPKWAALLRQVSDRALHRLGSSRRRQAGGVGDGGNAASHAAQPAASSAGAGAAGAADDLEAGTLPHKQLQQETLDASTASSAQQPCSGAPPAPSMPAQPQAAAPVTAGPAPAAAAAAAAAAAHAAGGLQRPSAASVWRDAGWDAAGGLPVGIITLEDVLEELMQEEIVDETDAFIDNEKTCAVNARTLAMSLPPGLRRLLMASQQRQAAAAAATLMPPLQAPHSSSGGTQQGSGAAPGAAGSAHAGLTPGGAATPVAAVSSRPTSAGGCGGVGGDPRRTSGGGGGGLFVALGSASAAPAPKQL